MVGIGELIVKVYNGKHKAYNIRAAGYTQLILRISHVYNCLSLTKTQLILHVLATVKIIIIVQDGV